ncbi:hypothetical protein [Pedobacter sp. UYP1]|uniref:hypothetical protein n=1 Tax=Pedobacter sp. UYP1 TaxID=1756396 RepID=UPI003390AEF6
MRILFTAILFISIVNISYGQNTIDKQAEAGKLLNQASHLMYDIGDGSLAQQNSNLKQSIVLAKKSIQLGNDRRVAYEVLIGSYSMLKDTQGGIDACSEWINSHPNDIDMRLRRGIIYHRIKKQKLAEQDFRLIKNTLEKEQIKISNKLSKKEVAGVVSNAYTYLLMGERKKSLEIMNNLSKAFPDDKKFNEGYKEIRDVDIEEKMFNFTGV